MGLNFNIEYKTAFGEELFLNAVSGAGDDTEVRRWGMTTADGCHWTLCLADEANNLPPVLDYYYSVCRDGEELRREWTTEPHRQELVSKKSLNYTVNDNWMNIPEDSYLYTSAFTDCVNRRKTECHEGSYYSKTLILKVRAPQLRSYERLALVGEGDALGNWDIKRCVPMSEHNYNEWTVGIDAGLLTTEDITFKFVAINTVDASASLWETETNRTLTLPSMTAGDVAVYEMSQAFFAICDVRLAGTLVPVFSLRSETSFGIGDFGDLKKMIDWVAVTGQRVLQVLPVNDTTTTHSWIDSYPYSCISIFALHPQYVDVTRLPKLKDSALRQQFESLRLELNALPQVDYERVNKAKNDYLEAIYRQEGNAIMATSDFKRFFDETERWLVPYAQYSYLRDKYGTADFACWEGHNVWDEKDRKALSTPSSDEYRDVAFFYFVQFVLDAQLKDAHDYARSKNVIIKGDIPIGVNRNGCDVWTEPQYFNMNGQAGAPPDFFSSNGQNWGFPTYNWDAMLADGCEWWVRRFRNMSKYFDAYRIDHVLGFFRIWEIPIESVHGVLGQFAPALGFSKEDIEGYGLSFSEQSFTEPRITNNVIEGIFRQRANEVKDKYLKSLDNGFYVLLPQYDTQRKVESYFSGTLTPEDEALRDGLYSLVNEVLFTRDHKTKGLFHPRISVQSSFVYNSLDYYQRIAFDRLYNDYYFDRNNQFWYNEAMKKLPRMVQATRMLTCAEDLGMVPDSVAWAMNDLRILSLEIQTMPKEFYMRFSNLSHNPYRSVSTISTHDMPTMRQWWDGDWPCAQDYYNNVLRHDGPAPHPMPGSIANEIVRAHLCCPSMLCVIAIQDWLAIDENLRNPDSSLERVNMPANPHHYWRYRMHVNIEKMIKDASFSGNVSALVAESGR